MPKLSESYRNPPMICCEYETRRKTNCVIYRTFSPGPLFFENPTGSTYFDAKSCTFGANVRFSAHFYAFRALAKQPSGDIVYSRRFCPSGAFSEMCVCSSAFGPTSRQTRFVALRRGQKPHDRTPVQLQSFRPASDLLTWLTLVGQV